MPNAQDRTILLLPDTLPGVAIPLSGRADAVTFSTHNPARDGIDHAPAGITVLWAGWLSDDADPVVGRFPLDFRLWTRAGWDALSAGLAVLAPVLDARRATLWLRPASGCILADPQACMTFLRGRPSANVGLLLDPVAMLTADMLGDLDDHIARAISIAGLVEGVEAVVLAAPVVTADGRVKHHPLTDDPRRTGVILDAWAASPLASLPVVVIDPRDAALLAESP